MSVDMQTESRKGRRTANACIACRQSKIKCSGVEPCSNCQRRIIRCRFEDGGNKIIVSERYLRELQRLSHEQQQRSPEQPLAATGGQVAEGQPSGTDLRATSGTEVMNAVFTPEESPPHQPMSSPLSIWTSPFASPSTTIQNTHPNRRKWIWLAPTSTWSFTVRLGLMITEKLQVESPSSPPSYVDGNTYSLQWKSSSDDARLDISGLPSADHALYLFSTVKFHLGQHYRLFDDTAFIGHVNEFYYGNAQEKARECRLWFVQFLIVLAFGKAFLSRSKSSGEPPGAKYFVRAMSLMPDTSSLWKDSLMAIEVLVLAALYLYSIDQRESAHVYAGQAMRIAQLEGLHTQLPEDELGSVTVSRCRTLWWTLYIIDRHFSTSLGLPMSTADNDITAVINPPNSGSQDDTILSLQVKLSRLLTVILTTIYKTEKTHLSVFLETTRSILHTMAGHAQEFENIIHGKLRNSVETMPRGTRHITLLYHQCVIVATRPLLLSVLKERLEKLGVGNEDWQSFLSLTTTLISTGIKSAVKTLQILGDEDSLLEVFLPFDLEYVYGAALHLIMANAIFPGISDNQLHMREAQSILDEMISKGNKVAEVRKAELVHLEGLCQELAAQSERRGLQALTLVGPEALDMGVSESARGEAGQPLSVPDSGTVAVSMGGDIQPSPSSLDTQTANNLEFLDNIGISSCEFLSIVDQMGSQDIFPYGVLDSEHN